LRVPTAAHCCRYYHAWLNGILLDDHELGESTQFQARIPYDNVDCTDAARGQHVSTPWPAVSVSDVASHSSSNKCAHKSFALLCLEKEKEKKKKKRKKKKRKKEKRKKKKEKEKEKEKMVAHKNVLMYFSQLFSPLTDDPTTLPFFFS
jgi:hypothetical protein